MYQDLTQRFTAQLQLKQPPIGLTFVEHVPEGIPHSTRGVPSACTFWRLAEQGVFYATGKLGQICTGFEVKCRKSARRLGIGVRHPSNAAPDAASSIDLL